MKEHPQNQASGASETTRLFCTRISPAAGAAGELCTIQRKEPDMAKRENEGKKEKKQKKESKEKRKQYRGLLLNPISVPRARTRACEGRRNPQRHHCLSKLAPKGIRHERRRGMKDRMTLGHIADVAESAALTMADGRATERIVEACNGEVGRVGRARRVGQWFHEICFESFAQD